MAKTAEDVTDAGLAATLFVAPLFLGGRHDVGRLAFAVCIAVTAIAWCCRQFALKESSWRRTPANGILLAGTVVLALQLVPLPSSWLESLAPLRAHLVEPWLSTASQLGISVPNCASLNVEATRLSLAMWTCYAVLFVVVAQRLRQLEDIRKLQRAIGLAAGWMAILGVLQWLAPNGKLLWVYDHPSRSSHTSICGPFANRNHFGHFLIMGGVCLAAWAASQAAGIRQGSSSQTRSGKPDVDWPAQIRQWAPAALLALVTIAALLTGSRGVAIALAAGGLALAPAVWRQRREPRRGATGLMLATVVGLALAVVAVPEDAADRIATVVSGELEEVDQGAGRRKIWQANWDVARSNGWLGAGAGTHADVYRTFMPEPPATEFTHAENGYLQLLSENGLLGACTLALALALIGWWCIESLRVDANAPAYWPAATSAAALVASLVHSAVDFVWFIPACITLGVLHAACLMRTLQLNARDQSIVDEDDSLASYAMTPLAAAGALVAALALIVPARSATHWDGYLRASRASRIAKTTLLQNGATDDPKALGEFYTAQLASLESMLGELRAAVRARPRFPDAHRQLANRCVELFELKQRHSDNPMPLSEIRNAAIASQFESRQALLDWLAVAFGDNARLLLEADYHARSAVALSPLEGDAHLRLAELAFLHGGESAVVEAELRQALRVRPHDGAILLAAGAEYAARGNVDAALKLWKRSFAAPGTHRLQLAALMGRRVEPQAWIEWFEPRWDSLPAFWAACRELVTEDQAAAVAAYAKQRADEDVRELPRRRANALLRQLAQLQSEAKLPEAAEETLVELLRVDPHCYPARAELGVVYEQLDRLEDAETQFAWCVDHCPGDAATRQRLAAVRRHRLARRDGDSQPDVGYR